MQVNAAPAHRDFEIAEKTDRADRGAEKYYGHQVSTTVLAPLAPKSAGPKHLYGFVGRVWEPKLTTRATEPLARQIHMQRTVVIDAIVDEQGNVVEAKIVPGPTPADRRSAGSSQKMEVWDLATPSRLPRFFVSNSFFESLAIHFEGASGGSRCLTRRTSLPFSL